MNKKIIKNKERRQKRSMPCNSPMQKLKIRENSKNKKYKYSLS